MALHIFDCTLRDGGHLTKWNFDIPFVKAAYSAALESGIDYFEAGYRLPFDHEGLGEFAYCTDEFLRGVFKPSEKCKLTVMIDAGKSGSDLFVDKNTGNTPVQAIRVAAYPYELELAIGIITDLFNKGYIVFLNLMASSELKEDDYQVLADWKEKDILRGIYFADSFGSLFPGDIPAFVEKLQGIGYKNVGFHSHNNLQLAFANSLKAIEAGAEFIDASIYGMGRGSGNLPMELFMGYLQKSGEKGYSPVPYLNIIDRYVGKLHNDIKWGYSVGGLIGGLMDIHPHYVHKLLRDGKYPVQKVWNLSSVIKEQCPVSFSAEKLHNVFEKR